MIDLSSRMKMEIVAITDEDRVYVDALYEKIFEHNDMIINMKHENYMKYIRQFLSDKISKPENISCSIDISPVIETYGYLFDDKSKRKDVNDKFAKYYKELIDMKCKETSK